MKISFTLLALFLSGVVSAQSDVKMFAATATTNGKVEVRLRWQIGEGWVPPGGFKVYRTVDGTKSLVKLVPAPSDEAVDRFLGTKYKGRKLASGASTPIPSGYKLDLKPIRPPSSISTFTTIKSALTTSRALTGPALTTKQRAARQDAITVLANAKAKQSFGKGGQLNLPSNIQSTLGARSELHLAAAVDDQKAETVGLGTTDTGVRAGQAVSYSLVAVSTTGQESAQPLATIEAFKVGEDLQPPAPSGIVGLQDEDTVSLRWERLPLTIESQLILASYRVYRIDPTGQKRLLTSKPLLILTLDGNREPVSFFSDKLLKPGSYTYQVVLNDGFERSSQPGSVVVTVEDWRRPTKPTLAGSSLGLQLVRASKGTSTGKISTFTFPTNARPTVAWMPGSSDLDLNPKFNIYRADLDDPNADPVKVNPTPVDGSPVPFATPDQLEDAIDLLMGKSFIDDRQAEIDDIASRPATSASDMKDRAIDVAKAKAKLAARINSLKAQFTRSGLMSYEDNSARKDRRYTYFVTSVYQANGLESEESSAGEVDVPDFAKPPAVSGLSSNFSPSPPKQSTATKLPENFGRPEFVSKQIKDRKALSRVPVSKPSKGSLKGQFFNDLKPLKLNLPTQDYGGKVNLTWNAVPGLKSVKYQIRRRLGEDPPTDVGTTSPDVTQFSDSVPRTRARDYTYEVLAKSRWGVTGVVASLKVQVPATMPPDVPNVISVAPGADREVVISIEAPSLDQGVTKLVVSRDGQQIGFAEPSRAVNGIVTFSDANRSPDAVSSYTVWAETSAGAKSAESSPVKGSALKLTATAVTQLVAQATAKGIQLTWTKPVDAVSFVVRRAKINSTKQTVLATGISTAAYLDTSSVAGQQYVYSVTAIDASGNAATPVKVQVAGS